MVGKAARLLAPIALASVAVGVYLVVHSTLATHTRGGSLSSTISSTTTTQSTRRHRSHKKFYTVKPGDTLSSIAAKTGVPFAVLTRLNPSVSTPPYSLQPGQRLKL
jgi:LysM repeat protein